MGPLIGRPVRPTDLTPVDFSVWGIVKEIVYANKSNNLDEMKEAIRNGTPLNTLMVILARKSAALLLRAAKSVSLQKVAISRIFDCIDFDETFSKSKLNLVVKAFEASLQTV